MLLEEPEAAGAPLPADYLVAYFESPNWKGFLSHLSRAQYPDYCYPTPAFGRYGRVPGYGGGAPVQEPWDASVVMSPARVDFLESVEALPLGERIRAGFGREHDGNVNRYVGASFVGPLKAWQWRAADMEQPAFAMFLAVGDGDARLAHKTLGEGQELFSRPNVDGFAFA